MVHQLNIFFKAFPKVISFNTQDVNHMEVTTSCDSFRETNNKNHDLEVIPTYCIYKHTFFHMHLVIQNYNNVCW